MKQVTINDKDVEAKVGSETLLRGRWLLVARLFWGVLALAIVVLNVLAAPAAVTSTFLTPVSSKSCMRCISLKCSI